MSVDIEKTRSLLTVVENDDDLPVCNVCGCIYMLEPGDEQTPLCDGCAHLFINEQVPKMLDEIVRVRAESETHRNAHGAYLEELRVRLAQQITTNELRTKLHKRADGLRRSHLRNKMHDTLCVLCERSWPLGEPENHVPGCLASPEAP